MVEESGLLDYLAEKVKYCQSGLAWTQLRRAGIRPPGICWHNTSDVYLKLNFVTPWLNVWSNRKTSEPNGGISIQILRITQIKGN